MCKWLLLFVGLLSLSLSAAEPRLYDPTRPPLAQQQLAGSQEQQIQLKLQQIISRGGQHIALIDGRRVKAGQRLGEYLIHSIESRRVVLEKADRTQVTLTLFSKMKK